jgi:capsular exopolysaccharide synthesis family protein
VTSSFPEEGKTSTAINLAESFAHAGARVLLIDADLRGPRLHILRDLENDEGLTTLLSKDLGEIDTIPFVRRHEVNGVFLLPAGPPRSDRAELLDAQKLQKLLDGLRESFDYIIIDSSPVLTFSDAMLLSAVVDEVLFVVKSDSIAGSSVRRARQLLHNVGASIIGVVLNDVDPHSPHFYLNADQGHYYYNSNVGMKELPNGTKD